MRRNLSLFKVIFIFLAGISILAINVYFAPMIWGLKLFLIPSDSMSPILIPGDVVLVDLRAYHSKPPTEGEIIVFVVEDVNEGHALIKRVVRVDVKCTEVTTCDTERSYDVYVEGDNALNSYDSRHFGSIGMDQWIGKTIAIVGTINTDGIPQLQRIRMLD